MSYQVIARKYRPQRFADVVGQEHVTQTLANAIASGRIAHAYIFCGPRGTGKTTLARIFAKCLNCTDGPKAEFPDNDPRVQEITEGRALDVLEIDGASNNGVEQVRELRDTVRFAPASSRFKIYIIDEVHMLSTAAFNALLKTLEEPPAHVKFFFATTDPEKVLPTILSRCQRFDLRRIPAALISAHLGEIATKEGVSIDEPALFAIARGADGGMRDAQSSLDQLISFCGMHIAEADVLAMFGLTGRAQLIAMGQAILEGQLEGVLRNLDALARGGRDLSRLLTDLLGHFRNLLIYSISSGDRQLLEVSDAEFEALAQQSQLADTEAVSRVLEVLALAEGRIREVPSKRIHLEVSLVKAIQARSAVSIDSVLRQLAALREGESLPAPQTVAQSRPTPSPSTPRAVETPSSVATPPTSAPPTGAPTSREETTRSSPSSESRPQSESRSQPTPTQTPAPPAPAPASAPNEATQPEPAPSGHAAEPNDLWSAVESAMETDDLARSSPKKTSEISPERKRTAAPAPAAERQPPPSSTSQATQPIATEDFLNDPLIKQAIEIFKGQIVEIRPAPES